MQEHTAVPMFNFDRPRSARPATPPATPRLSTHWSRILHRDLFAADTQARDSEQVTLEAADGFRIAAEHHPAAGHTRAHVVVAGAVGVPQRFYRRFAAFAAAAGYATLTFDFRGLGRSAPRSLDGFRMDYFDWGRQDLAAAIAAMSRPDVPLYVVGHSFGGHAFGLVPQPERVAAMFTFGTGAGWHGWMPPSNVSGSWRCGTSSGRCSRGGMAISRGACSAWARTSRWISIAAGSAGAGTRATTSTIRRWRTSRGVTSASARR